jgi:hypothetical protein
MNITSAQWDDQNALLQNGENSPYGNSVLSALEDVEIALNGADGQAPPELYPSAALLTAAVNSDEFAWADWLEQLLNGTALLVANHPLIGDTPINLDLKQAHINRFEGRMSSRE